METAVGSQSINSSQFISFFLCVLGGGEGGFRTEKFWELVLVKCNIYIFYSSQCMMVSWIVVMGVL